MKNKFFIFFYLIVAELILDLLTPVVFAQNRTFVTATDFRGKTLRFQEPVKRIVCLIESGLSGLYMLGAESRIVGISSNIYRGTVFPYYAAIDERIKNHAIPAPGSWDFVNIESVVALEPDLVIIWSDQKESIAALEERGIAVYGVFIRRKEDVYKEIADLGRLTGKEERAAELIAYTRREIERFREKTASIPESRRPNVYYMWAQGNLETSCGDSTVNDLIGMAGGRNVCASLKREHLIVKLEEILAWNPDVIVMWYNDKKNPEDIVRDRQWKTVEAVRKKRVHELPEVFLCDLWTLKFLYAAKTAAKWIQPDIFRDIDMDIEKRDMLKKFYGQKFESLLSADQSIP